MMENLLVIPGAQKCATTSVFKSLIQHPNIDSASTPDEYQFNEYKEIEFFANNEDVVTQNIDWYESMFESANGHYPIDASPIYLISEEVPRLINKFVNNPKCIILIRDPIRRAYSSYWQNKSNLYKEDRTFEQILNNISGDDFENVQHCENSMLERNIKSGSIAKRPTGSVRTKDYFRNKYKKAEFLAEYQDPMAFYKYFQMSSYSNYIEIYEEHLGENNVKIIVFEKLINNMSSVLAEIFNFLNIENIEMYLSSKNTQSRVPVKNIPDDLIRYLDTTRENIHLNSLKTVFGYLINKFLYTDKPEITEEIYQKGKSKLRYEYDYWSSEYPEIDSLWSY